jgi:hypothetical protein
MTLFAVALVLALLLHIFLGWEWTLLAGFVYGIRSKRLAWPGAGAVGLLSWGILLLYSYIVAPEPMGRMVETVGALLGGIPYWAVTILTLVLGFLLGVLGGLLGSLLAKLIIGFRKKPQPSPDIPNLNFTSFGGNE